MRFITGWLSLAAALLVSSAALADVTISAAISLKPALEKAQPLLEKALGDKIAFNFGASGTLAGQIRQGAPVDLFISADRATADKLIADKSAEKASEQVLAGNALVLIVPAPADDSRPIPARFADLEKVTKLAVGDPKVVPAGAYAREVLEHLKLWDPLATAGKVVTAENVAQVLTFVRRGEVDAGIVYATDAKNQPAVRVVATADPATHSPIEYVSVIPLDCRHPDAAAKTQQVLAGPQVQAILRDFGFTSPPPPATKPSP